MQALNTCRRPDEKMKMKRERKRKQAQTAQNYCNHNVHHHQDEAEGLAIPSGSNPRRRSKLGKHDDNRRLRVERRPDASRTDQHDHRQILLRRCLLQGRGRISVPGRSQGQERRGVPHRRGRFGQLRCRGGRRSSFGVLRSSLRVSCVRFVRSTYYFVVRQ